MMTFVEYAWSAVQERGRRPYLMAALLISHGLMVPAFFYIIRVSQPRFFAFFVVIGCGLLLLDLSLLVSKHTTGQPLTFPSRLQPALSHRALSVVLALGVIILATVGTGLAFYSVMTIFFTFLLLRAAVVDPAGEPLGSLLLIVVGSFLLIVAQLAFVPYYHWTGDSIYHSALSLRLARAGFLDEAALGRYANLPVFHAIMSSAVQVADQPTRLYIGLVVGILFQATVVAVYVLLRKFNETIPVSLVGSILMAINPIFLRWGTAVHAQVLSFVFLVLFLLIFATRFRDRRNTLFVVVIIITWVHTHQLSVLISIALVGMGVVPLYLYSFVTRTPFQNQIRAAWYRYMILVVSLITYWTIVTQILREPIWWITSVSPMAQGVSTRGYYVDVVSDFDELVIAAVPEIIDKLHYGVWLGIAALGVWTVLALIDRSDRYRLVALLVFPLAALFALPNPAWVPLQGIALRGRWELMTIPFIILMPAIAVRRLLRGGSVNSRKVIAVSLVFLIVFISIGSGMQTPSVTGLAGYDKRATRYLTEQDFAGMDYAFQYTNDTPVYGTTYIPLYMRYHEWKYHRVPGGTEWVVGDLERGQILFQPGLNVVQTHSLRTKRAKMVVSVNPTILDAVSEDTISIPETRGSRVYDANATEIYYATPSVDN